MAHSRILSRATPDNPLDLEGAGAANIAGYSEILQASHAALLAARARLQPEDLKANVALVAPDGALQGIFAIPFERAADILLGQWEGLQSPERGGFCRLPDGGLFVTATTHMPGVSGAMLQWWFTWCDTGYKYKVWHPEDHVWCTWDTRPGEAKQPDAPSFSRIAGYEIGRTHVVTEHLGKAFGRRAEDLHIQFLDPAGFGFTREACEAAGVAWVCCCRTCVDNEPGLGRVAAGRMIHIARKTSGGLELRSFFWLGKDTERLPDPDGPSFPPHWLFRRLSGVPFVKRAILKDVQGEALTRHAFEEFNTLAAVLPRLFHQEASEHWKEMSSSGGASRL